MFRVLALIASKQTLAQINNGFCGFQTLTALENANKLLNTLARKSPLEHSAFRSSTSWTYICMQKNNILEEI